MIGREREVALGMRSFLDVRQKEKEGARDWNGRKRIAPETSIPVHT
jgi:hypothetical protein